VGAALGWGALAASSVVIGALLGCARDWPSKPIGRLLGFGAGALISAISFELFNEGFEQGGSVAVGAGLAAGAMTYFVLNRRLERRGGQNDDGSSLALGAFLDGIPEQLALGLSLAGGEAVSAGLLVAIFVSNLPESIGSASESREAGRPERDIVRLWIGVAAVSTLAAVVGYVVLDDAGGELVGAIQGFAAGALIVMLVDTMIPDATRRAGGTTGLFTTLGFAVAALISMSQAA
jgi:ZIP family zinc transporter